MRKSLLMSLIGFQFCRLSVALAQTPTIQETILDSQSYSTEDYVFITRFVVDSKEFEVAENVIQIQDMSGNIYPSIGSGANLRSGEIAALSSMTSLKDTNKLESIELEILSNLGGSEHTTGNLGLAILLVDFLDSGVRPFSKEEAAALILEGPVKDFYGEQSFNQVTFSAHVADWQQVDRNGVVNGICRWPGYQNASELDSILIGSGIDLETYNRVIVLSNHACLQGGLSSIGISNFLVNGQVFRFSLAYVGSLDVYSQPSNRGDQPFPWTNFDRIFAHELGHSLGLQHSNGLDCGSSVYSQNCFHVEYGNSFDVMGGRLAARYTLHFNAYQKELLGWVLPEEMLEIEQSGRYGIKPIEYDRGGFKAAKIRLSNDQNNQPRWLYLEYRRPFGFDANLFSGSLVSNSYGLFANVLSRNSGIWYTRLLDLDPTELAWDIDTASATLKPCKERFNGLRSNLGSEVLGKAWTEERIIRDIPEVMLGPVVETNDGSIVFEVGLGDAPCFELPPALRNLRKSDAGPTGTIEFQLVNYDYFTCKAAQFLVSVEHPPELEVATSPMSFSLPPRYSQSVRIEYSGRSESNPGEYELRIHAEMRQAKCPSLKVSL